MFCIFIVLHKQRRVKIILFQLYTKFWKNTQSLIPKKYYIIINLVQNLLHRLKSQNLRNILLPTFPDTNYCSQNKKIERRIYQISPLRLPLLLVCYSKLPISFSKFLQKCILIFCVDSRNSWIIILPEILLFYIILVE